MLFLSPFHHTFVVVVAMALVLAPELEPRLELPLPLLLLCGQAGAGTNMCSMLQARVGLKTELWSQYAAAEGRWEGGDSGYRCASNSDPEPVLSPESELEESPVPLFVPEYKIRGFFPC